MKQIKSVSSEGIHYVDEDGTLQFIDFSVCNQNWLEHQGIAPDCADEWDIKCVGVARLFAYPAVYLLLHRAGHPI